MAALKRIADIKKLNLLANTIRQDVIRMLLAAGSGHSGGSLGMTDVFTALYFNVMKHNPNKPFWGDRDRLVLSNGHICPVMYAAMANAGYFPKSELKTLRKLGTRLQGHPHRTALPGVETSSGPLGSGLSQASGMAYAAKIDRKKWRIYCCMSDGELDAGNSWEGFMFAGKHKLDNLTAILDRNNIQIDGHTEDIMPLEPLRDKFEAFNWHVIEVDGHNIRHVIDACEEAKSVHQKPTIIIAHTVLGKDVSFMEDEPEWHGKAPTTEQAKIALTELMHSRREILVTGGRDV